MEKCYAVISVTWSRLQSPYYLPTSLEYADRAYDHTKQASGNISLLLLSLDYNS